VTYISWGRNFDACGAISSLGKLGIRALVLITLIPGLCLAFLWSAQSIYQTAWWLENGQSLCISAALIAAVWWLSLKLARRRNALPAFPFLAVSLIIAFAVRLLYLAAVDVHFVSDFDLYWKAAIKLSKLNNYEVADNIYNQRAIPFLLPLVELTNGSTMALKVANNLFLCAIQLMGYDMLSTALYTAAFWIISLALISDDVRPRALLQHAGWGGALGVVVAATEMARGNNSGYFVLGCAAVACVLLFFCRSAPAQNGNICSEVARTSRIKLFGVQVLAAVPVSAALLLMASTAGLRMSPASVEAASMKFYISTSTSMSDGSYVFLRRFFDNFGQDLMADPVALTEQTRTIAMSEFAERPKERLLSSAHRYPSLFRLGSRFDVYLPQADRSTHQSLYRFFVAYNLLFVMTFCAAFLLALLHYLRRPLDPIPILLVLTIGFMIFAMVLFIPVSSRYMYPIWTIGSIVTAYYLVPDPRRPLLMDSIPWLGFEIIKVVAVGAIIVFAFWRLLDRNYHFEDGRIITGWSFLTDGKPTTGGNLYELQRAGTDVATIDYKGRPIKGKDRLIYFGPFSVKLAIPGSLSPGRSVGARRRICVTDDKQHQLTFLYYTPYKNLSDRGVFHLDVNVDGKMVWTSQLPNAKSPIRVSIPEISSRNRCFSLDFSFRTDAMTPLKAANYVEIFYPHLTD